MNTVVFDATALVALIRGHDQVHRLWDDAGQSGVKVVIPSTAVLVANRTMRLADGTWDAILEDDNAAVLALTASNALSASRCSGDIAAAHVMVEAIATDGAIVTSKPEAYPGQRMVTFN